MAVVCRHGPVSPPSTPPLGDGAPLAVPLGQVLELLHLPDIPLPNRNADPQLNEEPELEPAGAAEAGRLCAVLVPEDGHPPLPEAGIAHLI